MAMTMKEFMSVDASKLNKATLIEGLKELPTEVKDDNLLSRVKYTLTQAAKSVKKVTVADLTELWADARTYIEGLSKKPVPAETATKKPAPKTKKEASKPVATATEKKAPAKKSSVKEATAPAEALKKPKLNKVATKKPKTDKNGELPVAAMFPEELTFDSDEGTKKLVRAHDKYHTMKELRDAINNGASIVAAYYWTRRHIKEYDYKGSFDLDAQPKEFPNDLDLAYVAIVSDTVDRLYNVSFYTEALYSMHGDNLQPEETTDDEGNKCSCRYCVGAEFELYDMVDAK